MRQSAFRQRSRRACAVAPVIAVGLSLAPSTAPAQTVLPDINVIAPTPLAGARSTKPRSAPAAPGPRTRTSARSDASAAAPSAPAVTVSDPSLIDRDKLPSNTSVLTSADFSHSSTPSFLDSVNRALPGVFLGDQTGNPFQRDLEFRGFTASPVQGTPQGIAVYQNGVRVNESWGDVVNWDFIPEKAIDRTTLYTNNPVFGLNAIGGALSIQMKNGFTWQGTEFEVMGGSNGRIQSSIQAGRQEGNFSAYALFESAYDKGWRDFASGSHINRMYADVGARNDTTEVHINFTGASNILGNVAATPVQMLNQSWSSVYTWPQTTKLQLAFLNASLSHDFSDTLAFQGNVYFRGFRQSHVDGNDTDVSQCGKGGDLDGHGYLCFGDDDGGDGTSIINGKLNVKNTLPKNAFLGEIDRNATTTNSFGGSGQFSSSDKLFGHDNHFVIGASIDHGRTHFTANSEVGTVDPNTLFVNGTGIFIDQPDADVTPVNVNARNTYTGVFATDTFDVTNRLSVTAGGRFNFAQIKLLDDIDPTSDLNGSHTFQRFNPVVGATYKLLPNMTAYAGYSEANRAPTPLELGCSNPDRPCMIDNFLVSDPPLKQVVARTVEAGLRGSFGNDAKTGQLTWGLGYFRTLSDDDILNVATENGPTVGYFTNAGKTLRQGFEAKANYRNDRWNVYANYTYVDATFRSSETLSSPNNLAACGGDEDCSVTTRPGDKIPGVPAHRFKIGAEYAITDAWKFGADLNVVGDQYLVGDYTNVNQKVPAYAVLNFHTSYQLTPNIELFGMINNALNKHYYVSGTFYETGGFAPAHGSGPNLDLGGLLSGSDNRTFLPGMPLAVYAGLKAKF